MKHVSWQEGIYYVINPAKEIPWIGVNELGQVELSFVPFLMRHSINVHCGFSMYTVTRSSTRCKCNRNIPLDNGKLGLVDRLAFSCKADMFQLESVMLCMPSELTWRVIGKSQLSSDNAGHADYRLLKASRAQDCVELRKKSPDR
jgi:hypothetical protein